MSMPDKRRRMRVLHLPYNIASQIDALVQGQRAVGIDARGLVLNNAPIQSCSRPIRVYRSRSWRRFPLRRLWQDLVWTQAVLRGLCWADVVHYRFASRGSAALPGDADLRYLARSDKPRVIDFCGSDIRIGQIAAEDNPYFAEAWAKGRIRACDPEESFRRQSLFARYGFKAIIRRWELAQYLSPELFPRYYFVPSPVPVWRYPTSCPDPGRRRPRIVHCPSDRQTKGTDIVLHAVGALRRHYDFDFRLVHGVSRDQALEAIFRCDIFIDQMLLGDYGMSTLEAMALGKPAVCYIKPSVRQRYPSELPVVSATPESLAAALEALIQSGTRRQQLGRRGRRYVEKYHDARQVAKQLLAIYQGGPGPTSG